MTVNLNIDGVALSTNPDFDYIPGADDIAPTDAQVRAYNVLKDYDEFVAVNTSPTGGGKTWGWLVPAVVFGYDTMAIYGTNPLITDQREAIEELLENHMTDFDVATVQFDGPHLRQLRREYPENNLTHGQVITRKLRELRQTHDTVIALTNPDVFTQLRHERYGGTARKHSELFDMLVVDEFHRADLKGRNSLLFLFDDLYRQGRISRFMFLSATPEEHLQRKLQQSMGPQYIPITTGDGIAQESPLSEVNLDNDWWPIQPPLNVEFRSGRRFSTGEALLDDAALDHLLEFCQQGRTVLILDSMTEVSQVYNHLSRNLPDTLKVERIDGFESDDLDGKINRFDVLVGNSAIEVGIDFTVEQAVLSGFSEDALLQRIGRLRNKVEPQDVVCYVPPYFVDRIERVANTVRDGERLPRSRFEANVNQAFPDTSEPEYFEPLYGAVEAMAYLDEEAERKTDDLRHDYYTQGMARIRQHYFEPTDTPVNGDELDRLVQKARSPLAEKLKPYRGSSLTTLLYDVNKDTLKSYRLSSVLGFGDVEFYSEAEFRDSVIPAEKRSEFEKIKPYTVGYCKFKGRRTLPDDVMEERQSSSRTVRYSPSPQLRNLINTDPEKRTPAVVSGLQVRVEDEHDPYIPGLATLNSQLEEEEMLCYPIKGDSRTVRELYNLDDFFFLEDLTDVRGTYSLAQGLNALYLHCHALEQLDTTHWLADNTR